MDHRLLCREAAVGGMYVCMKYLLDATNAYQVINIKSKVRMMYSTKQQNRKLFHLTKLYKQRIRKDFLWRSVKYSGSWYERIRVLKLARYSGMWYSLCKKSLNCFSSESLREDDRCGAPVDGRCVEDCRLAPLSLPLSTICAHHEFPFPPPSTSSTNLVSKKTEHLYRAL